MNYLKEFWGFLKKDTWLSWIVSLVLIIIIIRFIFFPTLSLVTGSSLPLVVVESCSMYHSSSFDNWWAQNDELYKSLGVTESEFRSFNMKSGLNKGDIIFVWGHSEYKKGDIIIFETHPKYQLSHPVIHRIINTDPISTKGDNGRTNSHSAEFERNIPEETIIGKSVFKVPFLGWIKLGLFEMAKRAQNPEDPSVGFCK